MASQAVERIPAELPRWDRFPALDGVRGIAVIVVLLFHGGVSWAQGGFLGVDAFFVLSGLLITSLLIDEIGLIGRVDLSEFWSRRARRLLPALLLVVAASAAYGAWFASPGVLETLRGDALATLGYVANWWFITESADYFRATGEPSVLRHTWSLAIEEQFYLVWPLVLLGVAVWTRARLAAIATVAGIGIVASAVAMAVMYEPGLDPGRVYFGTDTRAQVVLAGAALAAGLAALRRRDRPVGRSAGIALGIAAGVGLVTFFAAVALVDGDTALLYRGGFLVVAAAVAAVLAHIVLVPGGWTSYALGWEPLRLVGRVSYGLYLWHWPVNLVVTHGRTDLEGPALLAARLAVTAVIAAASYNLIEMPIRHGALPRWQAGLALPICAIAVVAAVLAGTQLPPVPEVVVVAKTQSGFPVTQRPARPAGSPARVLVVGDSVALTLAQQLERPARKYDLELVNQAILGCGVVRGSPFRYFGDELTDPEPCGSWPERWERHIREFDPDVVWMTVGRWEVMDRVVEGQWRSLGDPVFDRYVQSELRRAFAILTARKATVAVTTAPYFLRGERPDGGRWPEDDPARVDRYNQLLREVAAGFEASVAVLDLNARTSVGGQYTPVVNGVSMRYDGVHFSPQGARYLEPWLLGALREMSPLATAPPTTVPPTTRPAPGPTTPPAPTTSRPRPAPTTTEPESETTTTTEREPPTTTTTEQPPPVTLVP